MLHKETVSAETLDLIQRLMKDKALSQFNLVGGTALAFQLGHRMSIDIDLFCSKAFKVDDLSQHLHKHYGATIDRTMENSLRGDINGVALDVMTHRYPDVRPAVTIEGIRLASLEDIAAMKFNVITRDPRRLKDYIDMYYMLEQKPLKELVAAYTTKYPNVIPAMAHSMLLYHKEIDKKVEVKLLDNKEFRFKTIAQRLNEAVKNPDKIFEQSQFLKLEQKQELKLGYEQTLKRDDERNERQRNRLSRGRD